MAITKNFPLTEELTETLMESDSVDMANWRHGHKEAHVFEADGAHWLTWVDVHHEDGWQFYGKTISAIKVRAEEQTVTKWVPVDE